MTANVAPTFPPAVRRRVTLVAAVAVLLDMVAFGVVIPLLPFYVQSMGGSARVVGAIISGFSLTQLAATPLLGRLSDRYGRRPVIVLSLAGNALTMALVAVSVRYAWLRLLIASRLLAGATAGNISACQAAIADVTDESERPQAMGRVGAALGLGLLLGPVLSSVTSGFAFWVPPVTAAAVASKLPSASD